MSRIYFLIKLIVLCTSSSFSLQEMAINYFSQLELDLYLGYDYSSPTYHTSNYATNSPLNDARHSLIFLDGFDENTQSKLTLIPDKKLVSIRIGNSNNGSQSEKITYKLKIDSTNHKKNLLFQYATVLQQSNIDKKQSVQAKFNMTLYANGKLHKNLVNYNASTQEKTFHTIKYKDRIIKWKDWTAQMVSLSEFQIGDELHLVFENYDCAIGDSFGYSYIYINQPTALKNINYD